MFGKHFLLLFIYQAKKQTKYQMNCTGLENQETLTHTDNKVIWKYTGPNVSKVPM